MNRTRYVTSQVEADLARKMEFVAGGSGSRPAQRGKFTRLGGRTTKRPTASGSRRP